MTSLELFTGNGKSNPAVRQRTVLDWGTKESVKDKFDPSVIHQPTYHMRDQPVEQFYKESNLELSNLRSNDQL